MYLPFPVFEAAFALYKFEKKKQHEFDMKGSLACRPSFTI
jgi:hypothetical protein